MSPEAWPAVVDAHNKFVEQVFALGGSLAGGEALAPPTTATTIKAVQEWPGRHPLTGPLRAHNTC